MLRICQAAQSQCSIQSLSKSVSAPTHGRKESTGIQHCIKAIAGEVVNSRSVHLIKFSGGGQVIALKSATALILDRCIELCKLLRYPKGFSASRGIVMISGGASRPSSLGGETVQVRSIPLVDVSETSQRLDEVSRYQPHNQVLTDKKQKIITTWLWLLADFSA